MGKRWDARLGCWVLADDDVRKKHRVYDESSNEWVSADDYKKNKETKDEKSEATYTSCELPARTGVHAPMKKADGTHYKTCTCNECRPVEIRLHSDRCVCEKCKTFRTSKGLIAEPYAPYKPYVYTPVKAWDGVDRKKWPNTWMWLFSHYYIGNRWYAGKHISDTDFRDRVEKGIYRPEPKYSQNYWTGYGDYNGVD